MTLDITPLLMWLIATVLVLLAAYLAQKIKDTLDATPREARFLLDTLIETGVTAAEQAYKDEQKSGYRKLEYAMAFIRAACSRYGIKYDEAIIKPMIEQKINELFPALRTLLDE